MKNYRFDRFGLVLFLLTMPIWLGGCASSSKTVKSSLPCREQFDLARSEFEREKYSRAVEQFKLFLFDCPGANLVDTAQFFLSMSYYHEKDYPTAAAEFRKLLNSFPTSEFSDDALFMVGLSDFEQSAGAQLDQTYTLLAMDQFRDFIDIYPLSPLLAEAQKYLQACRDKLAEKAFLNARVYFRLKNYKSSRIYLDELLAGYPDSEWAGQAQFLLAESYRLESQGEKALNEYQKVLDNYTDVKLAQESHKRIQEIKQNPADRL